MPEFSYADLLPLGQDATSYKQLSSDGVTARSSFGRNFLEIEPQVLTGLTSAAMRDIAHLLRPAHLRQLRSILDDPSSSTRKGYGGGAAAQPDADGGTACLACIARTGAPRGAAPPHSVTIQACSYMYKS